MRSTVLLIWILINLFFSCQAPMKSKPVDGETTKAMPRVVQPEPFEPVESAKEEDLMVEEKQQDVVGYSEHMQRKALKKDKVTANVTIDDQTVKKFRNDEGEIAYNVPESMKVGESYNIRVRISKKQITEQLINGNGNGVSINDPNVESIVTLNNIRVSNTMSAALYGNNEEYKIVSNSTETQDIEDQGYTEWEWSVEPLKSGNNTLRLVVKVQIRDNGVFKDIVVFEKQIPIKSNAVYSLKKFVTSQWHWITTTFMLPLFIWWYKRKKEKEKKKKS